MRNVIVYNLQTDLSSPVLAAAHDWVVEISKHADSVTVFSTHVGQTNLPSNVEVIELGGGSVLLKVRALIRLYQPLIKLISSRKNTLVFHHMSPRTLLLVGPIYRFFGIKQGLWYSHSVASTSLKLSWRMADKIFTSTTNAFPYRGLKVSYVGHGIETEKFLSKFKISSLKRRGILALGRIVEVKNLEAAIHAISKSDIQEKRIDLIGSQALNSDYFGHLTRESTEFGVELAYKGVVKYEEVPSILTTYGFVYSGTPASVDKAVLEAAIAGCFILTTEVSAMSLSGMLDVWKFLGHPNYPSSLVEQINILANLSEFDEARLREKLSFFACRRNNLSDTIPRILNEIEIAN